MLVSVIYEESFVLYGQRHERQVREVVVQHDGESEEDFHLRAQRVEDALESKYSYFDSETLYYIPKD